MKFKLGQLVMTRSINDTVAEDLKFSKFILDCLRRHAAGDWGELSEDDKKENEFSVDKYLRLFSSYNIGNNGSKVWVITEADRSITTVLYPEDY